MNFKFQDKEYNLNKENLDAFFNDEENPINNIDEEFILSFLEGIDLDFEKAYYSFPVRQGYINMTGTFFDTIVVCTITGLAIASSGVLGSVDKAGEIITGSALTIKAFSTVLGSFGGTVVSIGITLFAFSTIIGWEYHGEKAFEYIFKKPKYNIIYRVVFSLIAYIGATTTLEVVWSFSDVMNGLMAIPNLISLLALSGVIAKDVKEFQKVIEKEKAEKKEEKSLKNEIA